MQPDCRDIKPVYEQITDGIRKMIITHAIPEGEKLPSVRELASKFAINPNAVRKAYQELEEKRIIYKVQGKGCFIRSDHIGKANGWRHRKSRLRN